MHSLWNALNRISLIKQIIIGLVIGIAVAMAFPAAGKELARRHLRRGLEGHRPGIGLRPGRCCTGPQTGRP